MPQFPFSTFSVRAKAASDVPLSPSAAAVCYLYVYDCTAGAEVRGGCTDFAEGNILIKTMSHKKL